MSELRCDSCRHEISIQGCRVGHDAGSTVLCERCIKKSPSSTDLARQLDEGEPTCLRCGKGLEPGEHCDECNLPSWIDWLGFGE